MKSEVKMTDSPRLVTDIKIWDGEGSLTQAETRMYLEYLHNVWHDTSLEWYAKRWDFITNKGLVTDEFMEMYGDTSPEITIRNLESFLKLAPILTPSPLERAMR